MLLLRSLGYWASNSYQKKKGLNMCFMRRPIWIIGMIINFFIIIKASQSFENKSLFFILFHIFLFFLLPLLIDFLTRCPKCSRWMSYHPESTFGKHNPFLPFYNKYCSQCGQNLDKCKIESDEIANKKLKK